MNNANLPQGLPDCALVRILQEKATRRTDTDFDYLGSLNEFRKRVSQEMRQVHALFPEYTPHDEEYHLKRLFHMADKVLGEKQLRRMNATELFILALGLYGHDWGMAVSDAEKGLLTTGQSPAGINPVEIQITPAEQNRFVEFTKQNMLKTDNEGHIPDIAPETWREYVRQTHPRRSGERIKKYFEAVSGSVAFGGAQVCEGHGLEFKILRDEKLYPTDYAALEEVVNLRALTVYVRLIDLLDMTEGRTPYVIWKFVAPRDPKSKIE